MTDSTMPVLEQGVLQLEIAAPQTSFPTELVLASAGSGKTYRISSRIIGLLAVGEAPDAVLASTFTRKAAGEILWRVLERLAEAAIEPARAAELTASVRLPGAAPVELDCAGYRTLLARTVRELHRLNVGTLDALFARTARSFAAELGLAPGWSIADEPTVARLRNEAMQEVLRGADDGQVVELVRLAMARPASRGIHTQLLKELQTLHTLFREVDHAADAWASLVPESGDDDQIDAESLAASIEAASAPLKKNAQPDGRFLAAYARAAALVRAADWETLVCTGLAARLIAGETTYYGTDIPDDAIDACLAASDMAKRVLGARYSARLGALRKLVERYDRACAELQQRTAAYRFDDVTALLGQANLHARGDVDYRLDATARHVLLDEFQDTSVAQWRAMSGAVESAAGTGGATIIVADPKQSIYGWRGASPQLVHAVGADLGLAIDTLATSWRSSQLLLDVVNGVFDDVQDSSVWTEEHQRAVAAEWRGSFATHRAEKDLPGYVRIAIGPEEETAGEHRPALLDHAAELVRDLAHTSPFRSIGVLTRTNRAVARLIWQLRRLGVDASEEGGNPLTDSAAVTSVLALLRLADHPGDRIARYHVATTPIGGAVRLTDPQDAAAAFRVSAELRRELLIQGYGRTLGRIASDVRGMCEPRDARRLSQLVESGFRFDQRAGLRPMDFVRAVQAERVEDPSSATVRVMTVHQSKGLEFDIVVLPELDTAMRGRSSPGTLGFRETPTGPITRVFPYVKKGLTALFPEVEPARRQQQAAELRDALSALYVAMTRARHALHIVLKPDGPNGPGKAVTAGRLVREALRAGVAAAPGDEAFYEHGDPLWDAATPERAGAHAADRGAEGPSLSTAVGGRRTTPGAARAAVPSAAPAAAAAPAAPAAPATAGGSGLLRPAGRRSRLLGRRAPSQMEGGGRVDLRQMLSLDGRGVLEIGSLVHAWCEAVGWLEDGVPDDAALAAIAARVAPTVDPLERVRLQSEWRQWLAARETATVLSRSGYPDGARLERELRFLHRDGDTLVQGAIDRLVLVSEGGKVVAAEVLDFKTDAVDAADAMAMAARTTHYGPQLAAYRAAVAARYRLPQDTVRARLLFLRAGRVVGM